MGSFCPMLFWVPYMFLNIEQRVGKMGIFDFLLGIIGHMTYQESDQEAIDASFAHLALLSFFKVHICLEASPFLVFN